MLRGSSLQLRVCPVFHTRLVSYAFFLATLTLSLVCVSATGLAAGESGDADGLPQSLVGQKLPAFEAQSLSGGALTEADMLQGNDVGGVLTFAASWCAPCLEEIEAMADARSSGQFEGVRFGVVVIEPDASAIAARLEALGGDWTLIPDPDLAVAVTFGAAERTERGSTSRVPLTIVFDAAGTVTRVLNGYGPNHLEFMEAALSGASAEAAEPAAP